MGSKLLATLLVLLAYAQAKGQDLHGVVDLHVHCDPDVIPRSIDALDLARLAKQHRIRGLLLKNHYFPTAPLAYIVQKAVPGIEVYGGVVLNRAVGGINPEAVERMANLKGGQGKVVWFPTFDAENQVRYNNENRPFVSVSRHGRLLPEVLAVLDIAARYDLVIATGHSSPQECLAIIREARKRGIERIIVTHAMMPPIRMNIPQMQEAARMGAYIEFAYNGLIGQYKAATIEDYTRAIRAVGVDHCILTSDLGQAKNPLHPDGLKKFFELLLAQGFSVAEINQMAKTNPARLLGLE